MTERTAKLVEQVCALGDVRDIDWSVWFGSITIIVHSHIMPEDDRRQPLHEIMCMGVLEWNFDDALWNSRRGARDESIAELGRSRCDTSEPRGWSILNVRCQMDRERVVLELNPPLHSNETDRSPHLRVVCRDIRLEKLSWSVVDVMWGARLATLGATLLRPSLRETARMIAAARKSGDAGPGPVHR